MTTFNTRGGYGIFERYLERSILWKKREGCQLTVIDYPPDKAVPSWSWMAYNGPIDYLDMPFDMVDWTKDYVSPLGDTMESDKTDTSRQSKGAATSPVLKSAQARRLLAGAELSALHHLVFDRQELAPDQINHISCIVFGKKKSNPDQAPSSIADAVNYVLIIEPWREKGENAYRRAGVGTLPGERIDWTVTESVEVY